MNWAVASHHSSIHLSLVFAFCSMSIPPFAWVWLESMSMQKHVCEVRLSDPCVGLHGGRSWNERATGATGRTHNTSALTNFCWSWDCMSCSRRHSARTKSLSWKEQLVKQVAVHHLLSLVLVRCLLTIILCQHRLLTCQVTRLAS